MRSVLFLTLCLLPLLCISAFAEDLITLDNGTELRGYILAWGSGYTMVYFQPEDKSQEPQWVSVSDIKTIRFAVPTLSENNHPAAQKKGRERISLADQRSQE